MKRRDFIKKTIGATLVSFISFNWLLKDEPKVFDGCDIGSQDQSETMYILYGREGKILKVSESGACTVESTESVIKNLKQAHTFQL